MAWLYVPGSEALNSDSTLRSEPTIEPWVTLSGKPTQRPFSWHGWRTRPWIARLSGMTLRPSTAARGVALWISYRRASPVSPPALPEGGPGHLTNGGSGPTLSGWWQRSSRDFSFWKTFPGYSPSIMVMPSAKSLPRWRRSGSMRNGAFSAPRKLERPIAVSDSSCWPTATAMDSNSSGASSYPATGKHHAGTTLTDATKFWSTSRASANENRSTRVYDRVSGRHLPGDAALWATPRANEWKDDSPGSAPTNGYLGRQVQRTPTAGGGLQENSPQRLNPLFVEWLMGWPIGWTGSEPLGMEWSHWLRLMRTELSRLGWD